MDGIIIINKPKKHTSHDIVNIVRKNFNTKKVGHTGTLDPNATGVLPLLVGDATKISKYLINHDKEYEVVLKLGVKTDTADAEGNIIKQEQVNLTNKNLIINIVKSFEGKQEQVPPMYSAIKVNGKKMYEYARKGEKIDLKPRHIEIYNMQVINIEKDEVFFKVSCSKGTYIRSLCEDIAKKIGTVGYMKELNRIKVGSFDLNDSISLEDIGNKQILNEKIITIQKFFEDKENIKLQKKQFEKFLNGVSINCENCVDGIYNIYNESDQYVGIGVMNNCKLKRDIILTHNL